MNHKLCSAAAMNLQLLQSWIATHISRTRHPRAKFTLLLVTGLFAVCFFATASFALDPQKAITQFVHTAWTEKDGAPASIYAITQTKDGYLWLRTFTGFFFFCRLRVVGFWPRG